MADGAPRRRRWPWLLGLAALAILFAALALDPARQGAWLARHARDDLGLELTLGQPARLSFWPRPALELEGVRATAPGSSAPLFRADRVAVALPWRALWSEAPQLTALTLDAPRFDLARIDEWLATRGAAQVGPPAPPRWPRLESPVRIRGASWVVNDDWALENVDLDLAALGPGAPIDLEGHGTLVAGGAPRLFAVALTGSAREDAGRGIGADDLELAIDVAGEGEDDPRVRWSVTGSAVYTSESWRFEGRLGAIGAAATTDLAAKIGREPERGVTLELHGMLNGAPVEGTLALALDPGASLIESLPRRLAGKLSAPKLKIGDVVIEGLQVEAKPEPAKS